MKIVANLRTQVCKTVQMSFFTEMEKDGPKKKKKIFNVAKVYVLYKIVSTETDKQTVYSQQGLHQHRLGMDRKD